MGIPVFEELLNVLVYCMFALEPHHFFIMFATILDCWFILLINLVNIQGRVYILGKKWGFMVLIRYFIQNLYGLSLVILS